MRERIIVMAHKIGIACLLGAAMYAVISAVMTVLWVINKPIIEAIGDTPISWTSISLIISRGFGHGQWWAYLIPAIPLIILMVAALRSRN